MPMFVSNPVIVEARKFNLENAQEIADWVGTQLSKRPDGTPNAIMIYTLEGVMVAKINDWIVKGEKDIFYSCDEYVFNKRFKEV